MAWATRVEVEYDTAVAAYYVAILNDDVKGLLTSYMFPPFPSSYPYYLGGKVWVDQSQWVRSVNISRGKSRFQDRMKVGSASVVFDNNLMQFSSYPYTPGGDSNPYALDQVPKKRVRISKYDPDNPSNFHYIFTGKVTAWNLSSNIQGDDICVMSCADDIADLAAQTIAGQTFPSELSSARITRILNSINVNWPVDARSIETGTITLQGDTISDNTSVLDYLDIVTRTEGGCFYIDADGNFVFRNRNMADVPGQLLLPGASFDFTLSSGYDDLYNQFVLSRVGGGTVTVDDNTPYTETTLPWGTSEIPGSQDRFGIINYEQSGLLFTSDADLETLGLAYAVWLGRDKVVAISSTIMATGYEYVGNGANALYGIDIGWNSGADWVSSVSHKISQDSHVITLGYAPRL